VKLSDQQRTEFGLFPKDWSITTIQSLLDDRSIIGHLDGNHGEMYPRADEFKEDGVPYITANDLNGAHVDFSRCKFLARDRASKFKKGIAKNGDVLFAHNATVGPTGLLTTDLDIVILSTTTTYYRCNPEKLNNRFLLYLLQAPMFVKQYRAVMAQSTRYQVPITTQRKLSVFLPVSRSEQEAIATALSDADALIESLEKLIAKKRLIKKGVMQGLLTSDETWRATNLLELCDGRKELFDDGDWIEAEHITNEGVRLIQT
jgi:type I restriction enzyme S subunit